MDQKNIDEKLGKLICELSSQSVMLDEHPEEALIYIPRLKDIYIDADGCCHRHKYAEISRTLYEKSLFDEGVTILLQNLKIIMGRVTEENTALSSASFAHFCKSLDKLYDHISLEDVRYGQTFYSIKKEMDSIQEQKEALKRVSIQNEQMNSALKNTLDTVKNFAQDVQKTKETLDAQEKTIQSHNLQSVSIIGLFASIILAFTGGYTMLTGVFANLGNIKGLQLLPYLVLAFIVGLVLFDLVFAVFRFISKLCEKESVENGETTKTIKNAFRTVNSVCIIGIVVSLCIYFWAFYAKQDTLPAMASESEVYASTETPLPSETPGAPIGEGNDPTDLLLHQHKNP